MITAKWSVLNNIILTISTIPRKWCKCERQKWSSTWQFVVFSHFDDKLGCSGNFYRHLSSLFFTSRKNPRYMCTQKWVLQHFSGIVDTFNAFGTYGTILYLAVWKHKVLTKPRVSIVSSFIYPQFPSFLLEQKKGGFFFKFWIIRELINYVKGRHSIGIFVLLNYESVVYVMCQGSIKRCGMYMVWDDPR